MGGKRGEEEVNDRVGKCMGEEGGGGGVSEGKKRRRKGRVREGKKRGEE